MLDGVSDVLKHFQASKLASVALLTSSVLLIVGPHFATDVPKVPDGWAWLVWTVMIFTAVQCFYWAAAAVYGALGSVFSKLRKAIWPVKLEHLSNDERFVLAFAAAHGGHFIVEQMEAYANVPESIAVSLAESSLVKRGLMHQGMMGGSFMSDEGKKLVLTQRRP